MAHRTLTRGKRIQIARTAHGYTQEFLADEAQVSQSTISHIENDEVDPRFMEMVRICKCLDIPLDVMAENSDPGSMTITFGERPKPDGPSESV